MGLPSREPSGLIQDREVKLACEDIAQLVLYTQYGLDCAGDDRGYYGADCIRDPRRHGILHSIPTTDTDESKHYACQ